MPQQDLAHRLKKPQPFVAKYEGGERRVDIVEFLAIARAIGIDPIKILRVLQKRQRNRHPYRIPKMIQRAGVNRRWIGTPYRHPKGLFHAETQSEDIIVEMHKAGTDCAPLIKRLNIELGSGPINFLAVRLTG